MLDKNFMIRNRLFFLLLSAFIFIIPTSAQVPIPISNLLDIQILNAGYNGLYRSDEWFPIQVQITNYGVNFSGRVVVRPETTQGINNTYSVAIPELVAPLSPENPTIAQTIFYAVGHDRNLTLHVELVNQNGQTVASDQASIRNVPPADRIYASISPSTVNLGPYGTANALHSQANWTLANIPTQASALSALNVLYLDSVDATTLTQEQISAIHTWVLNGGHLIIAGDSNVSTLPADLLPFHPEGITTASDFSVLERLNRRGDAPQEEMLIATGTVTGRILAENADGIPYIIRHELGYGTVDYLTFSMATPQILRWRGAGDLVTSLLTTVQPVPPWARGFFDWSSSRSALEIMPGLTLLPSVWSLILFLGVYVIVIGPLNYLVLSWMNRRDYAWVTIPLSIVLFSVIAYSLGFELRGETVTLNRLNVVQSVNHSDESQVDQLVGLLSPQRGSYNLSLSGNTPLRPLEDHVGLINLDRQSIVEIQQSNQFEAKDFTVDASFMMGFTAQGTIPRPAINGEVTVTIEADGTKTLHGYIQNNSGLTLTDPVIITAGIIHPLGEQLISGLTDFSANHSDNLVIESASPSNQEYVYNYNLVTRNTIIRSRQSAYVFTNEETFNIPTRSTEQVEIQRSMQRDYLIKALLQDQYATTGQGSRVYLVGWGEEAIFDANVNISQQQLSELNTTLYIIELATNYATQAERIITQDQFTWAVIERGDSALASPVFFDPTFAHPIVFRFTPQPSAVLDQVDTLTIILDRTTFNTWQGAVELWNWDIREWERFETTEDSHILIDNPAPYLGMLNSVDIRTIPPVIFEDRSGFGTPALNRLGVMQTGS